MKNYNNEFESAFEFLDALEEMEDIINDLKKLKASIVKSNPSSEMTKSMKLDYLMSVTVKLASFESMYKTFAAMRSYLPTEEEE